MLPGWLVTCSPPPCNTRGDGRWRSSWVSPPSSRPPPRPPPRPGRRCQSAGGHTREDQSPWTPRAVLGCDCGWGEMLCKHKEDQKCPLKNANCLLSSWRKVLILLNLSLLIVPGHVVGDPRKQQMFILLELNHQTCISPGILTWCTHRRWSDDGKSARADSTWCGRRWPGRAPGLSRTACRDRPPHRSAGWCTRPGPSLTRRVWCWPWHGNSQKYLCKSWTLISV